MKPKRGDRVEVHFVDHVEGADSIMQCIAYGRIYRITATTVTIDHWIDADRRNTDRDSNVGRYTLIRSAIKRIVKLIPARVTNDKARPEADQRRRCNQ